MSVPELPTLADLRLLSVPRWRRIAEACLMESLRRGEILLPVSDGDYVRAIILCGRVREFLKLSRRGRPSKGGDLRRRLFERLEAACR